MGTLIIVILSILVVSLWIGNSKLQNDIGLLRKDRKSLRDSIGMILDIKYDQDKMISGAAKSVYTKATNYIRRLRKEFNELSKKIPATSQALDLRLSVFQEKERLEISVSEWRRNEREIQDINIDILNSIDGHRFELSNIVVVDGDTVKGDINGVPAVIRIAGYDSPEIKCHTRGRPEIFSLEAKGFLSELLGKAEEYFFRLDRIGEEEGWVFDRYGRLVAHLIVDGVHAGIPMIRNGLADVVQVFPIERGILQKYKQARTEARIEAMGIWSVDYSIGSGKLSNKAMRIKEEIVLAENLADRSILGDVLSGFTTRSKNSLVVHKEDCRYIGSIKSSNVEKDITLMNVPNARPCKSCGGDQFMIDLINEYIVDKKS